MKSLQRSIPAADNGEWEKAQQLADDAFAESADLSLAMAAGLMHYCRSNFDQAKALYTRALSMHQGNDQARMMLHLIDFITAKTDKTHYSQALMALDWRSPAEFLGYLTKILAGQIDINTAVAMGDTDQETSLLHYVAGLMAIKQGNTTEAENHFQKALSKAAGGDRWPFLMAMAKLEDIIQEQVETMPDSPEKNAYQSKAKTFVQTTRNNWIAKAKAQEDLAPLQAKLHSGLGQPS